MAELTAPEPAASRREVDQLREELHRLDDHGSRGVGTLQTQVTELVKDVTELRAEVSGRFTDHLRLHNQEQRDRVSARRWLIGTGIAGLASIAAVIALLVQILKQLR